jgi:hypothetical protein
MAIQNLIWKANYFLFSFVLIGILFYLIQHSPSGWEDESGFRFVEKQKQQAPQLSTDWVRSRRLRAGNA